MTCNTIKILRFRIILNFNCSFTVFETKIFIFGGTNGKEYFNDLFVLDLEVMAWTQPKCEGPLPSPRHGHVAIQVGTNKDIPENVCRTYVSQLNANNPANITITILEQVYEK